MDITKIISAKDFETLFEDTHTCVIKAPNYQIVILKTLEFKDDSFEDHFYRYILIDNKIFYIKTNKNCREIKEGQYFLEDFSKRIDILDDFINDQSKQIEKLEDSLYERKVPRHFMDVWFYYKKDSSKIERTISRNQQVLIELAHSKFQAFIDDKAHSELEDLLGVLNRNANYQIQKLDSLHHYYNSIKGDRMNHSLYLLALVSGIFLPLNLIVGFFGMNTNNLFLKDEPNATQLIFYSLCILFFSLMLGLPLLKVVDQWIFRKFLGRYEFYTSITKKLDDISDKFSGQ